MKEIDIEECKGVDEFKEAEAQDLKTLMLTVMPNLELVNLEPLTEEERTIAKGNMSKSCINYFKNEVRSLVKKVED